jgi:hypothetical protein
LAPRVEDIDLTSFLRLECSPPGAKLNPWSKIGESVYVSISSLPEIPLVGKLL